jgi:hypothetical protein
MALQLPAVRPFMWRSLEPVGDLCGQLPQRWVTALWRSGVFPQHVRFGIVLIFLWVVGMLMIGSCDYVEWYQSDGTP